MGVAFDEVSFSALRPAVTLNKSAHLRLNLGERPLKYLPAGARPVLQAKCASDSDRRSWGYRFAVRPLSGPALVPTQRFERLAELPFSASPAVSGLVSMALASTSATHQMKGQASSADNGHGAGAIWRPRLPEHCAFFGDVLQPVGTPPPTFVWCAAHVDGPFLANPLDFKCVWKASGRANSAPSAAAGSADPEEPVLKGALWRPIPPPGYAALGDVYTADGSEPDEALRRRVCVARRNVLERMAPSEGLSRGWYARADGPAMKASADAVFVVKDKDSNPADPLAEAGRVEPPGLWKVDNQAGTFLTAIGSARPELKRGKHLDGPWRITGASSEHAMRAPKAEAQGRRAAWMATWPSASSTLWTAC